MSIDYKNIFESVNFEKKYGLKLIHWACLTSDLMTLKSSLKVKGEIETRSINGWRPIHFASFTGNEKMVQLLIESFCDFKCKTDNDETALDIANGKCNYEFIDDILNENIDLKFRISMGLKCGENCDHKFCLKSEDLCKFDRSEPIAKNVFKVKDSNGKQDFVVKIMKNYFIANSKEKLVFPILDQILPSSNHPNIVKWFGMIKRETDNFLFMECINRLLLNEINLNERIDCDIVDKYYIDILRAIKYLHDNKILHRFIHPTNIFIDTNDRCKLAISNYSYSLKDGDIKLDNDWLFKYKQYSFAAPELVENGTLSYPYDIWLLGCTIITMLTGNIEIYTDFNFENLENILDEVHSDYWRSFIKHILKKNASDRATANDLLNEEFITNRIKDNSNNNIIKNNVVNVINNAFTNEKVGISMKLVCHGQCEHKFCLSSVTATNFDQGQNIGSGGFGEVYKIKIKPNTYMAMKKIKNRYDENIQKEVKYLEDDIIKYKDSLEHDNIVLYYGAVKNLKEIFIFMEYIDGESLKQKINQQQLPLTKIKKYTKQILEGILFLHNKKIMHRDIKSENILIHKSDYVKIVDFGFSRYLHSISANQQRTYCGTPVYMAPEVKKEAPYDFPADIWSLGITVFEMATCKLPKTTKIEIPPNIKKELKDFINLMLKDEPKDRSSAESLLKSSFFK